MPVNIFNDPISDCRIGNTKVTEIYQGNDRLYPSFAFRATYSGGSVMEVDCDTATTLTTAITRDSSVAHYTLMSSAEIGSCIDTIGSYSFSGLRVLTSITMTDSVETLKENAIQCDSVNSIVLSKNIKYIETNGLNGLNGFGGSDEKTVSSLDFPNLITAGNYFLWHSCHIEYLTIGDKIESIGSYFLNFDSFTISSIKPLKSLTILAINPPSLGTGAFYRKLNAESVIYVPAESVNAYKSTTNWSDFASYIQPIQT